MDFGAFQKKAGLAFNFRSGLGYVEIPDRPTLNFGAGDFSLELWAYFTSLSGSRALMAKDAGPGQNNKWIFWANNGQLQLFVETGPTSFTVGSGSISLTLNSWHHLAVTRSGSTFAFYIDGVLNSTAVNGTPVPPISASVTFGQAENSFFMGGLEDEVTIYNRALSPTEIFAVFNADSAGKCGQPMRPFVYSQPHREPCSDRG